MSHKKRSRSIQYSQNFLVNPSLVRMLLKKAGIKPSDVVLEIGPGRGAITRELARFARKVIAIEKDRQLAAALRKELATHANVAIVPEDFLQFTIKQKEFKIFSNPPFNVSSKIIRKLVQLPDPPLDTYLIMQHEAAKRFASMNQEYLFSVQFRPWFTFRIVHSFRPTDFRPSPNVRTVLFRMARNKNPALPLTERKKYIRFVAAGVTGTSPSLRKNLQKIVTPGQWKRFAATYEFESEVAPLDLEVAQWVALYRIATEKENISRSRK